MRSRAIGSLLLGLAYHLSVSSFLTQHPFGLRGQTRCEFLVDLRGLDQSGVPRLLGAQMFLCNTIAAAP